MSVWRRVRPRSERDGHPFAPGHLPVVGHLPLLYEGAAKLFRRSQAEVGPVFWIDMGFGKERLFCVGPESLDLLRSPSITSDGAYDVFRSMGGRSLLMTDGATHRHVRSAMTPTFSMQGLSLSGFTSSLASMVEGRVDAWLSRGAVAALPEMQDMALDIMLRAGGVPVERLREWRQAYGEFTLGLIPVPGNLPGLPHYRSARAQKWLDAELKQLIERARLGYEQGGLLGTLVHARSDNGELLSVDDLVDNLRVIFFAGHETSASVMAWILLLLSRRPALWRALMDEHEAQPDAPLPASPKDLRRFPVAEAIFRETVRMYSPGWFLFRTAVKDFVVSGRTIKEGTPLAISPAALGRDPNLFSDPDRFDLGRWLGRTGAPTPIELSPFGGGTHFCLGYGLAMFEAVCVQVALARECMRRGLRLAHRGPEPRHVYLPIAHPSTATPITFERV
ncbi:cytochrome P450 [Sorangium sp. So ce131]|uniref:cytochrome P450 n=1 Tax=Sorangium sp. So ce131 TaxID=3133282 RepID=UPI003F61198D